MLHAPVHRGTVLLMGSPETIPCCESPGHAVAGFLTGAWRGQPPKLEITEEHLAGIAPLLLKSGAGALGWWRLRQSSSCCLPVAQWLRNAYLQYAAQGLEHEHKVANLVTALSRQAIRCILLKGYAAGRFYSEPGLRPPGDIDLCVPPEDWGRVQAILSESKYRGYRIDLEHAEFSRFNARSFDDFYARGESIWLEGAEVRVLSDEDHLRFLCFHLLKHGGWRPVWLCDIAAVLERLPTSFDWDRCLGPNKLHAGWILCTIGLAREILEAHVTNPHPRVEGLRLPRWLVNALLRQWNDPDPSTLPLIHDQIREHWRHPRRLLEALRKRWPNAIQATVDAGAPFDDSLRLPLQLRNCTSRAMRVLRSQHSSPNP
jgi:hypothetical protein